MRFYLTDTHEEREILVRPWTGCGYGPDCFGDLEPNVPRDHDTVDGDDAYLCTANEYDELVKFWTEEIRCINAREIGQNGDDYTEMVGDELIVFAG